MPNTQEIGWNAVSKTGVVAAGGARGCRSRDRDSGRQAGMRQMPRQERFSRSMSQTTVPVPLGVRCHFLSLTRKNRK